MLLKTESSGAGAISFLQELRSPGVNKSVNPSTAHICAFCETKSLCKNTSGLFCGTNSHTRQAQDQPEVGYLKSNFYRLRLL